MLSERNMSYEIHRSNKRGFHTNESYIVTRGRESFLRIVGGHRTFDMMTATASEDNPGGFRVCADKLSLIAAAVQIAKELGVNPAFSTDSSGREFVNICNITLQEPNKASADEMAEIDSALNRFFQIFDTAKQNAARDNDDMQEIYAVLTPDDSGEDVYLSDGIWLSSDGALHDRGR